MIPVKIILREEAVRLGLTENQEEKGGGVVSASSVGKIEKDGSVTEVERVMIKANGEKELIFMAEERKEYFKKKGNLEEYISQFKKIPRGLK